LQSGFSRRGTRREESSWKTKDVWEFEKLEQQFHSFLDEMSELSRKKPNDRVNKFKLKFINTTLDGLNKVLKNHTPLDDFKQFDVDDLPSTSDVVVILAQYRSDLQIRREHTTPKWATGSTGSYAGNRRTFVRRNPTTSRLHPPPKSK